MPATITPRGYIRVCHNGFEGTLTAYKNKSFRKHPDYAQFLCKVFNDLIFADNFHPENWFPKEKKKYLFGNVCWQWHTHKAKRPKTLKQQKTHLMNHINPRVGHKSIKELTRQDFYWIREDYGDTDMARGIRSDAQAVLNWAWKEGMLDRQLFLPTVKVTRGPTPYIEIADRWEIHRRMPEIYQDATLLSIEMGMRIGEIVALRKDAIDLNRGIIRIIRSLSDTVIVDMPKGGDEVWLPLDMPYIVYTKKMLEEKVRNLQDEWIFSAVKGGHIWPVKMTQAFKTICREIGIPQAHMHHNRNSFTQDRIDEGFSLDEVQALLGHKDQKTTARYKGFGIRRLKRIGRMR